MKKFKQNLLESFIGAIALGWVFAQGIIHVVYIIAAPISLWAARRQFVSTGNQAMMPARFSFADALPELVKSVLLLLLGYFLLRWLYSSPTEEAADNRVSAPENPF